VAARRDGLHQAAVLRPRRRHVRRRDCVRRTRQRRRARQRRVPRWRAPLSRRQSEGQGGAHAVRPIDLLKVVLVLVALAIWGYGARTGRNSLMIVGIAFMVVAFLLRWVDKIMRRR